VRDHVSIPRNRESRIKKKIFKIQKSDPNTRVSVTGTLAPSDNAGTRRTRYVGRRAQVTQSHRSRSTYTRMKGEEKEMT